MTDTEHPSEPDRIGVALASIAAGAATGAVVVTAGLVAFRDRLGEPLPLILFAGIVAAVARGWTLARSIVDTWRRGVTAALAAFGAMMLAGLAAPADMLGRRGGLVVYAVALAVGALGAARAARRAARP